MRLRVRLLSSDTPQIRAEKIVTMLGLSGDPALIALHKSVIADLLEQYREIDGHHYDSAMDSFRSYYAAIEAMRHQNMTTDGDR